MQDSIFLYIQHRQDSISRFAQSHAEWLLLRRELLSSPVLTASVLGLAIIAISVMYYKVRRNG